MVTREQFVNGLIKYMDSDVIPVLPSAGKVVAGAAIMCLSAKTNYFYGLIAENTYIKGLGMINPEGLINEIELSDYFIKSINKYGPATFQVPLLGNMTFKANDIEKMRDYMEGKF